MSLWILSGFVCFICINELGVLSSECVLVFVATISTTVVLNGVRVVVLVGF